MTITHYKAYYFFSCVLWDSIYLPLVDTTLGKAARQVLHFLALSCPPEVSGSSAVTSRESRKRLSIMKVKVFFRLLRNLSVAPSSFYQHLPFKSILCLRTSSLKRDATDGGTFLAQLTAVWSGWPGKEAALFGSCSPGEGFQH